MTPAQMVWACDLFLGSEEDAPLSQLLKVARVHEDPENAYQLAEVEFYLVWLNWVYRELGPAAVEQIRNNYVGRQAS